MKDDRMMMMMVVRAVQYSIVNEDIEVPLCENSKLEKGFIRIGISCEMIYLVSWWSLS